MNEDGSMQWYCGSCGAIFDPFDAPDWDDVHCPECFSNDVGAMEELEEHEERYHDQG